MHIGDEILPSYVGIVINHYKDPYEPTSIMESRRVFSAAQLFLFNASGRSLSKNQVVFHHWEVIDFSVFFSLIKCYGWST